MVDAAKLPVNTDVSAMDMAESMFGNGIKIVSASYSGADAASGIYSNGDTVAPGFAPSDTGVVLSTGNASSMTNSSGDANVSAGTTTNFNGSGDSDLSEVSGQATFDAAIFEAQFVPDGSTMTMQIVFSSEEYLEYVDSGFNDAVGVWVNGEPATLTVGNGEISIDNINNETNSNLYVDNAASDDNYNTEMDGFTVTLTLKAPVQPGQINTIKIGIADGGDGAYDSNLLIVGDSIQTSLVAHDDEVDMGKDGQAEIDVLANDGSAAGSELRITQINGNPVFVGDTIVLASGQRVTLTKDGMSLESNGVENEDTRFSYMVEDDAGNTDTAFVKMSNSPPCFASGTLIETKHGQVSIEYLRIGDSVVTVDRGLQVIRWIASREISNDSMEKHQNLRPILISAGALGPGIPSSDLWVSRQHRILIDSPIAQRMFGVSELLVPAKDLVGHEGITLAPMTENIVYVHLLFDEHEVIYANGAEAESLFLGEQSQVIFGTKVFAEMCQRAQHHVNHLEQDDAQCARLAVQGKMARKLVERHQKNRKPLVAKCSRRSQRQRTATTQPLAYRTLH